MKNLQPKYQEEVWKDIEGYEGYYQVSSHGRIKSLKRGWRSREKIRVFSKAPNGYYRMVLSANNIRKTISAHRAVAEAFIPNPHNYETVNHLDFDKSNNNVNNLEWASMKENTRHACINGRHYRKRVVQCDLSGSPIRVWESAYKVELDLRLFSTLISRCCRGKQKKHGGFIWRFYENN